MWTHHLENANVLKTAYCDIINIFDDITQKDTLSRSHFSNNESTSLINELNAAKHFTSGC